MIVDINHFNLLPDERVCDILQFANNRWQGDVCTRFRHLTNFIHVPEMLKTLTSFKADIPLPRRKKRESDRAYIMRSVKVMAALQNIYNNKESYGFKKPTPLPVVFKAVAKKERYIENAQVAFFCKKAFPIIYDPFLELRNSMAFIGESYRVQMAEMHGTAQEVDMSGGDPLKRLSGEIGCFTQIKTLNLSKNSLTFLPPALARLKNLRIIYLSRNQFTEFPKVLLKLKKLEVIALSENRLSSLPKEVAEMPKLRFLSLDKNPFPKRVKSLTKAGKEVKQTLKLLKKKGCEVRK